MSQGCKDLTFSHNIHFKITGLVRRFSGRRNLSSSRIHYCYIILTKEQKKKFVLSFSLRASDPFLLLGDPGLFNQPAQELTVSVVIGAFIVFCLFFLFYVLNYLSDRQCLLYSLPFLLGFSFPYRLFLFHLEKMLNISFRVVQCN